MHFSTKLAGAIFVLTVATVAGQAVAVIKCISFVAFLGILLSSFRFIWVMVESALNELSVVFYDGVNFTGVICAPSSIAVKHCYNLPMHGPVDLRVLM